MAPNQLQGVELGQFHGSDTIAFIPVKPDLIPPDEYCSGFETFRNGMALSVSKTLMKALVLLLAINTLIFF